MLARIRATQARGIPCATCSFHGLKPVYWMQDANAIDSLMEEIKQPIEQHGTVLQKLLYRYRLISRALTHEHFFLHQSHVLLARETMRLAVDSGNPFQISNAKRQLGMVELFAGQFDAAEATFREAISLCEKNNDMNSMLIARAYLSYTHRRQRKPQDLMIETELLENLLGQVSTHPAYLGLVSANRAGLHGSKAIMDKPNNLPNLY